MDQVMDQVSVKLTLGERDTGGKKTWEKRQWWDVEQKEAETRGKRRGKTAGSVEERR